MCNKISSPYYFSVDEKRVVNTHFKSHEDWGKGVFDALKGNIIQDLREKQGNKCCYCKMELGYDIKQVDIDHIIPKSVYPKFTFNEKNLALSCPACNTYKGKKDVLHKPIVNYPRSGRNLKIVHAYFDNYFDCIKIHGGAVYEGLNSKGCDTIKKCELFRLKSVLEKTRVAKEKESPISELVEKLRNASAQERDLLRDAIKDLVGI